MPQRTKSRSEEEEEQLVREILEDDGLLEDDLVMDLVSTLETDQRLFLAGLGRGMTPVDAARRAGWGEKDAARVADSYVHDHPIVRHLVAHVLRLRELASLDGEEPVLSGTTTIQ